MKGKHFAEKVKKMSKKSKSIILSVVAIIELVLLAVSMTFSWFEGLTSLEMKGEDIPTASVLNSHIEVGENKSASDTTYSNIIDLTKFYDAQKEVRLSPVSSADAEHFYAAYEGEAGADGTKYRELSEEDINSNIIRFEFTISSPDGPTDIYLSEIVPRLFINDKVYSNQSVYPYRFAYSDGTTTRVLTTSNVTSSSSANRYNLQPAVVSLNSDDTANTETGHVESVHSYRYKIDHSTSNQVLFHLEKNETKTITVSIWLEALDTYWNYASYRPVAGDKISFVVKLCTSWSIPRTITVYDYTADQWIDEKDTDNNHNDDMILCVRNMDGGSDRCLYELTYDADAKTWTGDIPIALQNCEFVWLTKDSKEERATWKTYNRGTNTEITMFGSDDYVWGIGSDDVTRIALSDNTDSHWLNNNGDDGNAPKMRIQINYEGAPLDYSMTDSPTKVDGLNTWYAYIPSSVDAVKFNRCDRTDNTIVYNYWNAPDRGTETVYYAMESGVLEEIKGTAIYLNVPPAYADRFFYQDYIPAVSLTSDDNVAKIKALNGSLASLLKSNYYMGAHGDTWIGTGQMTKINDPNLPNANIYAFYFDYELPDGEYLTFWNRSQSNNHNNIDNNVSFAPAIQYNSSKGNMLTISEPQQLTDANFSGCYISGAYSWSSYDGGGQGNATTQPEQQKGQWGGKPDLPSGTAVNFKHFDSSASTLTATFTYEDYSYSVDLTKGSDNLTWTTTSIPNSVTSIKFSDGTNTWSTSSRSTTNNYYYAVSTTKGLWNASGFIRVYFTNNYSWSNLCIHYWGGSASTTWPGNSLTKVGKNNQSQDVYVGLAPSGSTGIIFNNGNNGNQTSNITSNITDMKGFYISGGSGTSHTAGSWDVTTDWLKSYSD